MSRIPIGLSQLSPRTPKSSGMGSSSLGGGVNLPKRNFVERPDHPTSFPGIGAGAASMFANVGKDLANFLLLSNREKEKKRKDYADAMWVEESTTDAEKSWFKWMSEKQISSPDKLVETFETAFSEYKENALAGSPSDKATFELTRNLNTLGVRLLGQSLGVEAKNRAQTSVIRLNALIESSSDVMAQTNDPNVMEDHIARLNANIETAEKMNLINEDVATSFKESVENLRADFAEHIVGIDPNMARAIIEGSEGIPIGRRTSIIEKIERSLKTQDNLFATQQRELLDDHVSLIERTGVGNPLFNMEGFKASTSGGEAHVASRKIAVAEKLFQGRAEMEGRSEGEIAAVLEKYAPTGKTDIPDNLQSEVYSRLITHANEQKKLMDKDPFVYSLQDPVIKEMWDNYSNASDDVKPYLRNQMIEASLAFQGSVGIPKDMRSVLSVREALLMANAINASEPDKVENEFLSLMSSYGQHYPRVFRELSRLPKGQGIDPALHVVALHVGKPWLKEFVEAVRSPEPTFEAGIKSDFSKILLTDGNLLDFRSAVLSANPGGVDYAEGIISAVDKYAKSLYVRGKEGSVKGAINKASEMIIGSVYDFDSKNGETYAIKKQYVNELGIRTQFSESELNGIKHILSNRYQPFFDSSILGGTIDDIDLSRFVIPSYLTPENKKKAVKDLINKDAFWVTTPDNTGVILYIPGDAGISQPLRFNSGDPITLSFEDALKMDIQRKDRYSRTYDAAVDPTLLRKPEA